MNGQALAGDDLKGGDPSSRQQGLRDARDECEKILNRALRIHAPNFYGSIKFSAQKGKIIARQVLESEVTSDR